MIKLIEKTKGWKTYTAGAGLIIVGITRLILEIVAPDTGMGMEIQPALQLIFEGLGFFGVRHKLETLDK